MTNFLSSLKPQPNSWLQKQAMLHPDAPACQWNDHHLSFHELTLHVQSFAEYYHRILPKVSERIALYCENDLDAYFSILALWELGKEIQFVNTRLTTNEISEQMADAGTSILISANKLALNERITWYSFPNPSELHVIQPKDWFDEGYREEAIASIMYTSGTTGKPKGVPQTFANH